MRETKSFSIWTAIPAYRIQTTTIDEALHAAGVFIRASKATLTPWLKKRLRAIGRAYLNRACELACVPFAQYYAESSSGDLDLAWITYRPEAVPRSVNCDPAAIIYLGSVDNLSEDQARARAIGW